MPSEFYHSVTSDRKALVDESWLQHVLLQAQSSELSQIDAIPGSEKLAFCGTGFTGDAREQVRQKVTAIGGRYSGNLIRGDTTHLICSQFEGQKYNKANEWMIPTVSEQWLDVILHTRKIPGPPLPEGCHSPSQTRSEFGDPHQAHYPDVSAVDVSATVPSASSPADVPEVQPQCGSGADLGCQPVSTTHIIRETQLSGSFSETTAEEVEAVAEAELSEAAEILPPDSVLRECLQHYPDAELPCSPAGDESMSCEVNFEVNLSEGMDFSPGGEAFRFSTPAKSADADPTTRAAEVVAASDIIDSEASPEPMELHKTPAAQDVSMFSGSPSSEVVPPFPELAGQEEAAVAVEKWLLWPVSGPGAAGNPIELDFEAETTIGRSADSGIGNRAVSRNHVRVRLLQGAVAGSSPRLEVSAVHPVYVQRAGEAAATPVGKGAKAVLEPMDTLLLLLNLGKFHYCYRFSRKDGAAESVGTPNSNPVATPWDNDTAAAASEKVGRRSAPPSLSMAIQGSSIEASTEPARLPTGSPEDPLEITDRSPTPAARKPSEDEEMGMSAGASALVVRSGDEITVEEIKSMSRAPKGTTVRPLHRKGCHSSKYVGSSARSPLAGRHCPPIAQRNHHLAF
ncbi:hypothetical protein CYMTET_42152 [Cymbomonas tetramitiformis]|uniref:BRCT domain-containing protein n=1 Tax=Cymbomonas tetramitiformis TaxID=36881 RepID=A0AAE0F2V3_9CHLO|nr:hypothetical protein CYMTET_42152 [Cymbomonas tetramitiformis]